MLDRPQISRRRMLLVLHPVFALTGAADAVTGPLLPSLARSFHLSDSQSGLLFFWIFAGMATGALLCRGNYARTLTTGFFAMTVSCFCFPFVTRTILYPFACFFGISVGMPMTATSLFAGRNYPARRASVLTFLNFTWSAGAMLAPLLAARLLAIETWRAVFVVLACAAALATVIVAFTVRDAEEALRTTPDTKRLQNVRMVALFGVFFFLEVGMEVMFGAWISTDVLRVMQTKMTLAAAATAIYWTGFMVSRALSSLLLLRLSPGRLLGFSLATAIAASVIFVVSGPSVLLAMAILALGAALAPIFPVALSIFFDRARHSSDSRFILALSGFGGSLFSWLAGSISSHTGSLRGGLAVGPVTLLAMASMLPFITSRGQAAPSVCDPNTGRSDL
jgi:MFS transporter, FHS family, glucose/mannose:H+ symporter